MKKEIDVYKLMSSVKIKKAIEDLQNDCCPRCHRKLKHAYDSRTKKMSKYLFKCECYPNIIISRG